MTKRRREDVLGIIHIVTVTVELDAPTTITVLPCGEELLTLLKQAGCVPNTRAAITTNAEQHIYTKPHLLPASREGKVEEMIGRDSGHVPVLCVADHTGPGLVCFGASSPVVGFGNQVHYVAGNCRDAFGPVFQTAFIDRVRRRAAARRGPPWLPAARNRGHRLQSERCLPWVVISRVGASIDRVVNRLGGIDVNIVPVELITRVVELYNTEPPAIHVIENTVILEYT